MKRALFLVFFILFISFILIILKRSFSKFQVSKKFISLTSNITSQLPVTNYQLLATSYQFPTSLPVEIPKKLDFANENIPLDMYDIRERLDRELLTNVYWQSNTILLIKRAYRWFPIIQPILKQNKIPDDFKYLPLIESAFIYKASPAGAQGFWQFLKPTAIKYGLEINNQVDERYNLEKATQAACDYLKEVFIKYKSWTLAAVSYNAGFPTIDKQLLIQKIPLSNQSYNNSYAHSPFYDLVLNDESERYIFRILAIKILLTNPTKYGYFFKTKDLYPPILTYTLQVDTPIHDFADFAFKYKINYKILKSFNPWLRDTHLSNKDKKLYFIKIPKEGYQDSINKILNSEF